VIPQANVTAWRSVAPWADDAQVEQDLVLSRAIVELFSDDRMSSQFAMRGGTALNKLSLEAASRYSEDIDLVQVVAGPIRPFFDALHDAVDPWLGAHAYARRAHSIRVTYRFETGSVPAQRMRLKIEVNTREHGALLGLRAPSLRVANRWFTGEAIIPTFERDELLGTKLRALYQRSKGRDLFDLHLVGRREGVDLDRVVRVFREVLEREGLHVRRSEFEANLLAKIRDRQFRADTQPLLAPEVTHDVDAAAAWVIDNLVGRLP